MLVGELIKELQKYPEDLTVVVGQHPDALTVTEVERDTKDDAVVFILEDVVSFISHFLSVPELD